MLKRRIQFGLLQICRVAMAAALILVSGACIVSLGLIGFNILF